MLTGLESLPAAVQDKIAYIYGSLPATGTGTVMVKEFFRSLVKQPNLGKSKAVRDTVNTLYTSAKAGTLGAAKVSAILGTTALAGAAVLGASAIVYAGNKAKKEINKLGAQTAAQQESITQGIKARRAYAALQKAGKKGGR